MSDQFNTSTSKESQTGFSFRPQGVKFFGFFFLVFKGFFCSYVCLSLLVLFKHTKQLFPEYYLWLELTVNTNILSHYEGKLQSGKTSSILNVVAVVYCKLFYHFFLLPADNERSNTDFSNRVQSLSVTLVCLFVFYIPSLDNNT